MELQKEYEKLYQHWLREFQNSDLTELTYYNFNEYKKIVDFINDYKEEDKDEVKDAIFETYKDNINYLFDDLLKIRELKIINSALILNEINLDNVKPFIPDFDYEKEKLLDSIEKYIESVHKK